MIEIKNKQLCSGCGACYSICPKQCIKMVADTEGFLYPEIEKEVCINCDLCKKVCPALNEYKGNSKGQAYACINKDDEVRKYSSSGGVFTLLANEIIDRGGVVFGAAFDDDLSVHHIAVDNFENVPKLRGSKYLQSKIEDSYIKAKEYLEQDRWVLFSGTPCQISGLKAFLQKDYEKLIMQDIICHGVPSQKVWQKYLYYQKARFGTKADKNNLPQFRDKKNGWKKFSLNIAFENNYEYNQTLDKDLFLKSFLNDLSLRPSCYNCCNKSLERISDMTLADFWGVENIEPDYFDDCGTSLVLINSVQGEKILSDIKDKMFYKPVGIDQAIEYNTAAIRSVKMPKNRSKFMKNINSEMSFEKAVNSCVKKGILHNNILRIKNIINRIKERL